VNGRGWWENSKQQKKVGGIARGALQDSEGEGEMDARDQAKGQGFPLSRETARSQGDAICYEGQKGKVLRGKLSHKIRVPEK